MHIIINFNICGRSYYILFYGVISLLWGDANVLVADRVPWYFVHIGKRERKKSQSKIRISFRHRNLQKRIAWEFETIKTFFFGEEIFSNLFVFSEGVKSDTISVDLPLA